MQEEHVDKQAETEEETPPEAEADSQAPEDEPAVDDPPTAAREPEESAVGPRPPQDRPEEAGVAEELDAAAEAAEEVLSETGEADNPVLEADVTAEESATPAAEREAGESSEAEPTAAELSAETAQPTEAEDTDTDELAAAAEDEEPVEEPPTVIQPPPDDGITRRWYAVHAHSGQEANVQEALKVKAEQEGLSNLMTNVFVPMEDFTEYKSGEKKMSKRKFFPGYLLLQLPEHPEKYADLWHLIKDTPGVTGFIGSRNEPVPLEDSEVQALVEEIRGERERPKPKLDFDIGERVKINEGAFANFMGNIGEINEERGKLKVLIEIFERQTSVEVDFWQVEKI